MGKRTISRELALQMLYQLDVRGFEVVDNIEPYLKSNSKDVEIVKFAKTLVFGTWEKKAEIDKLIKDTAKNWEPHRMAIVDRNVLRLAIYELLFEDDTPPVVAINEAIELAKKFSTEQSGGFVNGILDNIRKRSNIQIKPRDNVTPTQAAIPPTLSANA